MATLPDWLTVTPASGRGDGSFSVSAEPNEGCDRAAEIIVEAEGGGNHTLTVTQLGRREPFLAADGGFTPADGGTYNVIQGDGI